MAAIYQWFPSGRFIDYEFVLLATDEEWKVRYVGYDYASNTFTDYGQFWVEKNCSVVSDGKNVFVDNFDVSYGPVQYIYRGHCFTRVEDSAHFGVNVSKQMAKISGNPYALLFSGVQAFGYGVNTLEYTYEAPYLISSGPPVNVNPPNNGQNWGGIFDLNVGNNGLRGYGDELVVIAGYIGGSYGKITTYKWSGVLYQKRDEYTTLDGVSASINRWGCNPQTGELIGLHWFAVDTRVFLWEVDLPTGSISYIGQGATTLRAVAVGFASTTSGGNSYVITAESDGLGGSGYIRTYSRSGLILTQVDEVEFTAANAENSFSEPSMFQISRMTGRIWFFTPDSTIEGGPGNMIIDVDNVGQITILYRFNSYSSGASGYMGQPVAFLDAPLLVTSNGFAGIKEKLFECWELDEIGSVNRVGSLAGVTLVPTGVVTDRVGRVSNAADLSGASGLSITGTSFPQEMRAVDDFTICLDVLLDNKATLQQFIGRGRNDYYAISIGDYDFAFYYSLVLDRFVFEVRSDYTGGTNVYTVIAHALGSPAVATWYHVCLEYNKTLDEINISVNDGAVNSTSLPLGTLINNFASNNIAFTVGRRSSLPAQETIYLNGGVDQIFWFWDILTPAEKTWMYNSGASRAFSEL